MHLFTTYQNFNIFHKCFLFDLCCVMMWVVLIDISLLMFIGSLKRIYSLILTVTLSCGMLLLLKRGVWIASLRSYGLPIHNWWLNEKSNKLEFIPYKERLWFFNETIYVCINVRSLDTISFFTTIILIIRHSIYSYIKIEFHFQIYHERRVYFFDTLWKLWNFRDQLSFVALLDADGKYRTKM